MSYEHVFEKLEVAAEPFAVCELRGSCTMGLGGSPSVTLHYILAGHGEIVSPEISEAGIGPGTIVLMPAFRPHSLRCSGTSGDPIPVCRPAELELKNHLIQGDHGSSANLLVMCSSLSIGIGGTGRLVDLIRVPIVETIGGDSGIGHWIDHLLQELVAPGLGSKAMIRAILLQCVIELLRTRLRADDPALSWMAALADERLWGALEVMLESPGGPHTVESLAEVAGMSRSSFAQRFFDAYGSGPMALLRELRLHRAASLLTQTDLPVKRVAKLSGFQSRSAFTRSFTFATGKSPKEFKREQSVTADEAQ
jgi:AraC-like DNA-binding protein